MRPFEEGGGATGRGECMIRKCPTSSATAGDSKEGGKKTEKTKALQAVHQLNGRMNSTRGAKIGGGWRMAKRGKNGKSFNQTLIKGKRSQQFLEE